MDNISICTFNHDVKNTVIKTDLSNHFSVMFVSEFNVGAISMEQMEKFMCKCNFNEKSYYKFLKQELFIVCWNNVKNLTESNEGYNKFAEIFTKLYGRYFPMRKIKIKPKRILSS